MKTVEKYGVLFSVGGTAHIQGLIDAAVKDGTRTATVTGNWDIESHIVVPANFDLIFDGCYLKMADNTFDNMFINEHHKSNTMVETDKNIRMIGKNGAILDGGTYNGLSEANHSKNGWPHIYVNSLIFFTNVDGFELADIALHNFRWWAVHYGYCCNGHIHDITMKADDTCFDKDGNEYHGLSLENYFDMRIRQADGIDIRKGCHHILIENIYGFTGDDTVALTALSKGTAKLVYAVEGWPDDISHIMVRHVHSASLDASVRLLCQGESTIHDVIVDDIVDISDKIPGILGRALQTVRIGDVKAYGSRQNTSEEFYNITVKNVRSRSVYAMYLAGTPIKNFVCENVVAFDGGEIVDNRWEGYEFTAGRKEKNYVSQ